MNFKGMMNFKRIAQCVVCASGLILVVPMWSAEKDAKSPKEDLRVEQLRNFFLAQRSPLAKHAEARGVTICIEPLNRFETDFLNTCDQGMKLIKAIGSPAVKLHLDTFHMNIEEKDSGVAIRKAGKYLGHFHACGSDRGTPGGDHTDWPSIVKALKAIGYQGDVVIESFTTDVKVIARAAAIWRKIEPRRNDIAINGLKFLRRALR